jgi:hypothetical protein
MVEGLNNNNKTQYPTTIKLKGKNKETKTIDLTKLEGLKRTEQNSAWFDLIDLNNNGTIDDNEVLVARNYLTTISQRDGKLTEQQTKLEQNQEYSEKNGDITTTVTKDGTTYTYSNGDVVIVKKDGTTIKNYKEGITKTDYPDGSAEETTENGGVIKYQNGVKVSYTDSEGNVTTFTPDGNKSVTKNLDGQTTRTLELKNNQEIKTEYEYTENGTIAREYTRAGDNAELTGITVSNKENGHTKEVKYSSEEDMQNNLPTEMTIDAQNPTLKKTTTYIYDSQGNVKAETENSAGDITETKYTDKDGKEIQSNQFDAPVEHTVKKGESITAIVKNALLEQGFTEEYLKNYPDTLKNAKTKFIEENKDLVKTYNGTKTEWKGNKYLNTGDKVTIPNFDKIDLEEIESVAIQPTKEAIAQQRKLQAELGDNYNVGYDKEGNIVVRDNDGNVLPKATEKANARLAAAKGSVSNAEDNEEANQVISTYDTVEKDNQLNKEEFKNYVIENLGVNITGANREQIEKIIDEGFASIDAIEKDGKISKEELLSSFEALSDIGNKIDDIEASENNS